MACHEFDTLRSDCISLFIPQVSYEHKFSTSYVPGNLYNLFFRKQRSLPLKRPFILARKRCQK
eukprot:scaffold676981_cov71-Prasinocladus_malaysianus.AAC.1